MGQDGLVCNTTIAIRISDRKPGLMSARMLIIISAATLVASPSYSIKPEYT